MRLLPSHEGDGLVSINHCLHERAVAAPRLRKPTLYKPGRMTGTRDIVVRANYVMAYQVDATAAAILRVLHATQQWPPAATK